MEVHHHSHSSHGKKNWQSYLWEFLMLFLAVFCGFLAEYQLEHVIEHNREKEYIKAMVDDLKTDSRRIANTIERSNRQIAGFDSLLQNIYHTPYTDSSIRTLYYLKETYTLTRNRVFFSKGTISQLKNSGGLRLIRKRQAVDSILTYDILAERIEGQAESIIWAGQKLLDLSIKIFDGEYVPGYYVVSQWDVPILKENLKLLSNDEKLIKEYANLAKFKSDVTRNYVRQIESLQNRIPRIIQFLEKEYHLN